MSRFKKGDKVVLINCTMGGRFFVEGQATVVKPPKNDDAMATVRLSPVFPARTGEVVERFIDPAAQANPLDFVSRLNASVEAAAAKVQP